MRIFSKLFRRNKKEVKEYYKSGELLRVYKTIDGSKEGRFKEFYLHGGLFCDGDCKNGLKEGEWNYYNDKGEVTKWNFLNGKSLKI